jgi:hypothetical protein
VVVVNVGAPELGELAELSPETIVPAHFRYSVHKQEIWDLCRGAIFGAERAVEGTGQTLGLVWQTYLGLQYRPRVEPWSTFVAYENSFVQLTGEWSGFPGHRYRYPSSLPALDARGISELTSILTIRTYFNDAVAGLVGVPYLPSAIRGGVHQTLLQRKLDQRDVLDALTARIGPTVVDVERKESGYARALSLPLMLGIVLSRLADVAEYRAVLADLRAELEPLRRKVAADRQTASANPGRFLKRYASYLHEATAGMPGALTEGSAVVGAAVAPVVGVPPEVGSGIGKLAATLGGTRLIRAYDKLVRSDVHAVSGLAQAFRSLRSAQSEIERVFKTRWSRGDYDELVRLAALPETLFVRLRSLEV